MLKKNQKRNYGLSENLTINRILIGDFLSGGRKVIVICPNCKNEVNYTSKDIRFTTKDNSIYAICLGWPENELIISALRPHFKNLQRGEGTRRNVQIIKSSDIKSVKILGNEGEIDWKMTDLGLKVKFPANPPCKSAYSIKIELN